MADKPADESQFAWDADMSSRKIEGGDPAESGTTYRLSNPAPASRPAGPAATVSVVEPVGPRRVASKDRGSRWALIGYNVLIFVTSVCVMTLELTASRIIGKHLGASLYTWTSVIGVILAGITLGNWLGGWLSDRFDRYRALGWMYLLASVSSGAVLFLEQTINYLDRPASVNWPMWVLTVVAFLFLMPAIALGATSPLIASLALSRSNRLGATVGNVYAWGACGSIVGTFLTGFWLVDRLGSRAIIGLVAGTLAVLAVLMAGKRNVFRVAVLCGWMQLFLILWLTSSATYENVGQTVAVVVQRLGVVADDDDLGQWYQTSGSIGRQLHELGLAVGLRDDAVGRYTDESEYSYIQVSEGRQDGATVKVLRLDKLIHSYYDAATPTALHYDYEQIYATVTKIASATLNDESAVVVPEFPGWPAIRAKLPNRVNYEETTRQMTASSVDAQTVEQLLELAPDADYWYAVDQLSIITTQPDWGGLASETLAELPDGVTIPDDLSGIVRFDASLRLLNAYQPVTPEIRERLIQASPRGPWHTAVNQLRQQAGKISTFFIGGGGYIFPRWIASEYPGSTRIDVAELDPAVRQAVRAELGMSEEDERLAAVADNASGRTIVTTIGDARKVVDDKLRENRARVAKQEPPVTYDFIYGDAFNDFSVPWHLTTLEFQQKLKELLTPRGIVQMNLIDIYPRVEYPDHPRGAAIVSYKNFLPKGLMKQPDFPSHQFTAVLPKFGKIEVNCSAASDFQIKASEVISDYQQKLLLNLDTTNSAWREAVVELTAATRRSDPYRGELPPVLIPENLDKQEWVPAKGFDALELQQIESGQFGLGYRGAMSDAERQKLLDLAPGDDAWQAAISELQRRSKAKAPGQFLGRFTYTAAQVFPNIYVFSTTANRVSTHRDTFVIVCSLTPLDLDHLETTGFWSGKPFATQEAAPDGNGVVYSGQMDALLALAHGQTLTDDFAPVENLLLPIFADQ